jgi:hypothetical protein
MAWPGYQRDGPHLLFDSTGSSFAPQTKVCDGLGNCPQTTSSPAIAANGSTIYLAWTTASDTILLGTYAGSGDWTLSPTPVPGATTTIAPALAVYDGALCLAWVEEGTQNVMYASFPLPAGTWSVASQVKSSTWTAQTSVAPGFGISPVPSHTGLYLGWTAASGSGFIIYYSQFNGSYWNPPIPIPPGPLSENLSPALVGYVGGSTNCGFSSVYSFDLAYTTAGEDIEWSNLQSDTIFHKCKCDMCP